MKSSALLIASLVAACTSPDYGAPTATTDIRSERSGGFVATPTAAGVHIIGNDASFQYGAVTGAGVVSAANLEAIIGALENIKFLDLDPNYVTCLTPASDAATVELSATVTAGSAQVSFYSGCSGDIYDKLEALETTILDKSGYTAWEQLDQ